MYLLWEADRQTAGKENVRCLENLNVLHRIHKNLAFPSTLSRYNKRAWELFLQDTFEIYLTIFA